MGENETAAERSVGAGQVTEIVKRESNPGGGAAVPVEATTVKSSKSYSSE